MDSIETVPKESMTNISFSNEEVLVDSKQIQFRRELLTRACRLGNEFHSKVGIVYKMKDGNFKRVITTIWDYTDRFISLKGGVTIPVHAVYTIEV